MTIKIFFCVFCVFTAISCTKQIKNNEVQAKNENGKEINSNSATGPFIEKYIGQIIDPIKQFRSLEGIIDIDLGDGTDKYFLVFFKDINTISDEIYIYLYIFNENDEMSSISLTGSRKDFRPDVIMKDIPGYLEGYFIAVGDYNGDGLNELFVPDFGGSEYELYIYGIELGTNKFTSYCEIPFFVQYPPDRAPVEFIKYNGVDGFKVLMPFELVGMEYPEYKIDGDYDGVGWMFYQWDETSRKYIAVEEVNPQDET
jgi:hypothetical protein